MSHIYTVGQRQCLTCGNTYTPTDDGQKFCQKLCKRQDYQERRFGVEHAIEWRQYQEAKHTRIGQNQQ